MCVAVAVGMPLAEAVIHRSVAPSGPELLTYRGTQGPFAGTVAEGVARVTESQSVFRPGDTVYWRTDLDVLPGATQNVDVTLWCGGRPVYAEDAHTFANQVRSGWRVNAMSTPHDARGQCEIRRRQEITSPDGSRTETHDLPTIHVTLEAGP